MRQQRFELRAYHRDAGALVSAYLELAICPSFTAEEAELAIVAARACTLPRLRALAEAVDDPWPWATFLRRLLAIPETSEARDAFEYLYGLAQQHLDDQGLELLRPEDLLADGPLERRLKPQAFALGS